MKRSCQRQTTGFDEPDRRMISNVPQPSAVARMIRARHDMLLGAVPIGQNGFQPLPITRPKPDLDVACACPHRYTPRPEPDGIFCFVQTTRGIS